MSARFYKHPVTGKLHCAVSAGGVERGVSTSIFDAPATEADITAYGAAYGVYLSLPEQAEADPLVDAMTVIEGPFYPVTALDYPHQIQRDEEPPQEEAVDG